MNNLLSRFIFILSMLPALSQAQKINLQKLLADGKIDAQPNQNVTALNDDKYHGISGTGIMWLKNMSFTTGSIDVDIHGKNVFQQSFPGIAFHCVDGKTYDCIYFRPFNFQSPDTLRRKHTVQYISEPDFSWEKLRNEHPLVYENAVPASLKPTEWFHAHIVVTAGEVIVYVNHNALPSLTVKKLNTRTGGMIGLWNDGLNGDFANLEIKNSTKWNYAY